MLRTILFTVIPLLATVCPGSLLAEQPSAAEVARQYFAAIEQKDLDTAESLFADHSSVFETGGDEGNWAHYRVHHIGAELEAVKTFNIELGKAEEELSPDHQMAFVAWPIEYRIALGDSREIHNKAAVSFVLTNSKEGWRIRHLHWSSRAIKRDSH